MDTRLAHLIALAAVTLAACGDADVATESTTTLDEAPTSVTSTAPPPQATPTSVDAPATTEPTRTSSPVIAWREGAERNLDAIETGTLLYEHGCLFFEREEGGPRIPIIWPSGSSWSGDTNEVIFADGTRPSIGTMIKGGGGGGNDYAISADFLNDLVDDTGSELFRCLEISGGTKFVQFDADGNVQVYAP